LRRTAGFEGDFVVELALMPQVQGVEFPPRVSIELGQQIVGGYEAGGLRTLRIVRVEAIGVQRWSLDQPASIELDSCLADGVELLEPEGSIGLAFDLPGRPTLVCSGVILSPHVDRTDTIKPWASDRMFLAVVPGHPRPRPAEWIERLRGIGLYAVWRRYGSEAEPASDVPEDYAGWFLQTPERINESPGGLCFYDCSLSKDGNLMLQLDAYDVNSHGLWAACGRKIGSMPDSMIHCGNCGLTGEQWLEYLRGGGKDYLDRPFLGPPGPSS
jgi:hypothetical protein